MILRNIRASLILVCNFLTFFNMSEKYKVRNHDDLYFITFATAGWIDVFTRQCYVDILLESIRFCQKKKGLEVYAWCVMSNHVHMIVGRNSEFTIPDIIRDLKKYTSKQIVKAIAENDRESRRDWLLKLFLEFGYKSSKHMKNMFWQNEYHPIALVSNEMAMQKLNYIHRNPVVSGVVHEPSGYRYSSAGDYENNRPGLLQVTFLY